MLLSTLLGGEMAGLLFGGFIFTGPHVLIFSEVLQLLLLPSLLFVYWIHCVTCVVAS